MWTSDGPTHPPPRRFALVNHDHVTSASPSRRTRAGSCSGRAAIDAAARTVAVAISVLVTSGCTPSVDGVSASAAPELGSRVQVLAPRCAASGAALVGSVVDRDGGEPVGLAAVFLDARDVSASAVERAASSEASVANDSANTPRTTKVETPPLIVTRTDEQGVFTICDPPSGLYRVAVYARDRRVEVRGVQLGQPGVTLVRVALGVSSVTGS
jgi:hypothetical protein